MYKIVRTTDHKYLGMIIDDISREIKFPDEFIMYIAYTKREGDYIIVGNDNYVITFEKEK